MQFTSSQQLCVFNVTNFCRNCSRIKIKIFSWVKFSHWKIIKQHFDEQNWKIQNRIKIESILYSKRSYILSNQMGCLSKLCNQNRSLCRLSAFKLNKTKIKRNDSSVWDKKRARANDICIKLFAILLLRASELDRYMFSFSLPIPNWL